LVQDPYAFDARLLIQRDWIADNRSVRLNLMRALVKMRLGPRERVTLAFRAIAFMFGTRFSIARAHRFLLFNPMYDRCLAPHNNGADPL
jgi:hypothetical protein